MESKIKKILFENGRSFIGTGFGADVEAVFPVVFHTAMVGYQEIISDPACCGLMVCMTYPLIGNYGLNDEDFESAAPKIGGLIVRECNDSPSNYRYTTTVNEDMNENEIPGIMGVDTREITRMLRDEGEMIAILTDADISDEDAMCRLKNASRSTNKLELVSTKKVWYSRTANFKYNVVAVDCGIKRSTIAALNELGCNVIVVPYNTPESKISAMRPDGIYISGGPGSPTDAQPVHDIVRAFAGKLPMLGSGLGHQIIALALGAGIERMAHPHRGANYAVRCTDISSCQITEQNHGYAVERKSALEAGFEITHENVMDGSVEGIELASRRLFSVQYSLSAGDRMLTRFIEMIEGGRENA